VSGKQNSLALEQEAHRWLDATAAISAELFAANAGDGDRAFTCRCPAVPPGFVSLWFVDLGLWMGARQTGSFALG
jgi:hypothetical protein